MTQKIKKIKVCFVFTFPVSGINADFLTNIPVRMKHLMGESLELSVLYYGIMNEEVLIANNIKPYKIKWPMFDRIPSLIRYWALVFIVFYFAHKHQWQIVLNANNHYFSVFVSLGAKLAGVKSVVRVTGILENISSLSLSKILRKWIGRLLERLSLTIADGVFALSPTLKNSLVKRGNPPDKIDVISTGVDTNRFTVRPEAMVRSRPRKLLYVGRVTKIKALEYAIEAFVNIRREYSDLKFIICGDGGGYKYALKQKYKTAPGLIFKDYVPYELLPNIYKECDIFVFPSLSEGLPNVVLEAMASGLPVIATNIPINSLLLDNGRRGILVDTCSDISIIEGIRRIITDIEFRINCVKASRKYIEEFHSFEAVRSKYWDFFNRVLDN